MNSRRRLPHSYPEGRWLFITWTLHGSFPPGTFPPPAKATSGEAVATSGEAFACIDRYLDNTRTGPQYLRQPSIAQFLIDFLFRGIDLGHYELGPFAIMPNHVHVLLKPLVAPSRLLKSLKGSTARESNPLLNRNGEQFWQHESYDHWVRDEKEWDRIAAYIEDNPVKAGLVQCAEDFRWSSAGKSAETSLGAAAMSGCATTGSPEAPES